MTIEEMKERKRELGLSNKTLAERSGVPIGTLQKIFSGATSAPREGTIKMLEKTLRTDPGSERVNVQDQTKPYEGLNRSSGSVMAEPPAAYNAGSGATRTLKKPGEFTLEDYLALPEDQRVEMIDGVFYDMAAPMTWHQAIGGFIYKQLLDFTLERGGECTPFMSPVDVQLDEDDKTIVQPDVLIVCDKKKLKNGRVFGAPDFLIEILSPSTRKRDMTLKHYKYANAGVREYWIVDPQKRSTVVYDLENNEIPVIYGEEARVPVLIWNGDCEVDFGLVYRHVAFLLEQ